MRYFAIPILLITACGEQTTDHSEMQTQAEVVMCSSALFNAVRASNEGKSEVDVRKTLSPCTALADDVFITLAKEQIEAKLKDPFSVQYDNIYRSTLLTVSGRYNAKNSFGAYAGFKSFEVGISTKSGKWYSKTYD